MILVDIPERGDIHKRIMKDHYTLEGLFKTFDNLQKKDHQQKLTERAQSEQSRFYRYLLSRGSSRVPELEQALCSERKKEYQPAVRLLWYYRQKLDHDPEDMWGLPRFQRNGKTTLARYYYKDTSRASHPAFTSFKDGNCTLTEDDVYNDMYSVSGLPPLHTIGKFKGLLTIACNRSKRGKHQCRIRLVKDDSWFKE